jgi:hypothetical protein
MRRLRQLEEENRRLKSIVADQALDLPAVGRRAHRLASRAGRRGATCAGLGSKT